MPSATANEDTNAFVDNYLEGWDDDDPFRSPSPDAGKNTNGNEKNPKKRKGDALGIDQEIEDVKKARVPRVKLDDKKLLSEKGIPKLRQMAPRLKLKGKGHEFSDAARLLSFYQEWLDDLFPKATFLDALAMVEKTGHKLTMRSQRDAWIREFAPKSTAYDDDELRDTQPSVPKEPSRIAPIFDKPARASTPVQDDLFGGEDIYNATPRAKPTQRQSEDVPEDEDLDALMAENEASAPGVTFGSIFGGGPSKQPPRSSNMPDDEDMDALMAEAEAQPAPKPAPPASRVIGGEGPKVSNNPFEDDNDEDADALMAEVEAQIAPKSAATAPKIIASRNEKASKTFNNPFDDDDEDMDALMAEVD
ncbi:replication fork protection component Swi3-domain-containing protein, partial [Echria macrotheca]